MSADLRAALEDSANQYEALVGPEERLSSLLAEQDLVRAIAGIVDRNEASAEFRELNHRGRLDLSLEVLVIQPEFVDQFDPSTVEQARGRLDYYAEDFLASHFGSEGIPPGTVVQAIREGRSLTRPYVVDSTREGVVWGREFWFEQAGDELCRYSRDPVALATVIRVRTETPPIEGLPLAEQPKNVFRSRAAKPRAGAFDWSRLHEIMERIPPGRWTTYGDLASVVGTAAQPLGQHIFHCHDCPNAQRVLTADGRVAENFTWTDPEDEREPVEVLRAEGLSMQGGRAAAASRLSPDEVSALLDPTS